MTESDWLACDCPATMLEALCGPGSPASCVSERKLRLFACACVRQAWPSADGPSRRALEVAEQLADGAAPEGLRRQAERAASAASQCPHAPLWARTLRGVAAQLARKEFHLVYLQAAQELIARQGGGWTAAQACLLRDIVGYPFRPRPAAAPWLTREAITLACALYHGRGPGGALDELGLGALADAAEEAGCADERLLAHLRAPGPHVRGCWAVDLILGRQ